MLPRSPSITLQLLYRFKSNSMKQPAIYAFISRRLCPWWQKRTNYYKIWHRSPLIFLLVRYMYIKLDSFTFCFIFWMFEMLISIKINLNLCFISMPFEVILSKKSKYFSRSLFEKIIKLMIIRLFNMRLQEGVQ